MLKQALAGAVALALTLAVGAAQAQATRTATVYTAISLNEMRTMVTESGGKVNREAVSDRGNPYLEVADEGGLKYSIYGLDCSGYGSAMKCKALEFSASFTYYETRQAALERAAQSTLVATKLFVEGKDLYASRYIALEGGMTRENIKNNLLTYLADANAVWNGE